MTRTSGGTKYVPALDGVRGICMLAVLIGHLVIFGGTGLLFEPHVSGLLGGAELCLEVFFVLSGALITHLALCEIESTGTLDLGEFRRRRVRRLAPALVLILIVTIALTVAGVRDDAIPLGTRPLLVVAAVVALNSNWFLFQRANLGYLTPTWSLSVEEQFYLAWPIALRRIWTRRGAGVTALAALSLLVAGLGVAVALVSRGIYATYATPVAGVGLLCGCLAAIGLHSNIAPTFRRIVGATPLALVLAGVIGISARWLHFHTAAGLRGGYLLFGIATALFIAHLMVRSTSPSIASRALSWRPLVHLGRISYGAYLFHATIYQMWDRSGLIPNIAVRGVVDVLSTLGVASLSLRFIEEPIRRGQLRLPSLRRVSRPRIAVGRLALVPLVAAVLVALTVASLRLSPVLRPGNPAATNAAANVRNLQHSLSKSGEQPNDSHHRSGTAHQPPATGSATPQPRLNGPGATPELTDTPAAAAEALVATEARSVTSGTLLASRVTVRNGRSWLAVVTPSQSTDRATDRMTIYQWQRSAWAVVGVARNISAKLAREATGIKVASVLGTSDPAWVLHSAGIVGGFVCVVSDVGGSWHAVTVPSLVGKNLQLDLGPTIGSQLKQLSGSPRSN